MAATLARVLQAIQTTLGTDTTIQAKAPGGVYADVAPPATSVTPWIVFGILTPEQDIQGRAAQLVMAKGQFQVQAVGKAPADEQNIQDAVDRADALLNGLKGLTIGGATVVRIARVRELPPYTDAVDDFRIRRPLAAHGHRVSSVGAVDCRPFGRSEVNQPCQNVRR